MGAAGADPGADVLRRGRRGEQRRLQGPGRLLQLPVPRLGRPQGQIHVVQREGSQSATMDIFFA